MRPRGPTNKVRYKRIAQICKLLVLKSRKKNLRNVQCTCKDVAGLGRAKSLIWLEKERDRYRCLYLLCVCNAHTESAREIEASRPRLRVRILCSLGPPSRLLPPKNHVTRTLNRNYSANPLIPLAFSRPSLTILDSLRRLRYIKGPSTTPCIMATIPNPLRIFAAYLSPAARARLSEDLRTTFELPPERADAILALVLDHFRQLRPTAAPHSRDPATRQERLERILQLLRAGAPIAEVAHTMGISAPRVSQLIAEARARGVDVPTRARGRPLAQAPRAADLLRLLQQGFHTREITKILHTSAAGIRRLAQTLRTRGESVPDPFEVDAWRMRWDQATFEALAAIRKYNGYAELADMLQIPEAKQATELEELRVDAKAKARHAKALESELPPHVVTVPPEPIREAAQKALRKESVAPTPKAPPNARHKPAVPYELRPNLLPTTTTLGERLTSAASDDPTIPAPTPAAPVRSLQDILAALNAKATPSTTPNT